MNKIIAVNNLHKSFNTHTVLDGVSFSAQRGEVLVLLGKSGSGKSTLLRCLNLLEQPTCGTVQINCLALDYNRAQKISPRLLLKLRTKVGMVFQQFNLWPHLTVLKNLTMAPIYVLKQAPKQAIAEAEQLLAKVGILHQKDYYPSQLSGGQQQRAAIARALMMHPEVMLFDESTSALDPEMKNEVLKIMQALAQDGMTMIIATHEIAFAKEVASHAIFLEHGKIAEQGKAQDILNYPKNEGLKQFLSAVHY